MTTLATKLHATALGLTLALTSIPMQFTVAATGLSLMASGQVRAQTSLGADILIIITPKVRGAEPVAKMTSDAEGMFETSGLEPGEYSVCFADDRDEGGSCADAKVGEEGVIRGQTVFDEKLKSKKHSYVGHVTLLR